MGVRYLLDTTFCIYIAKSTPPEVRERFARYGADELAMSVVRVGNSAGVSRGDRSAPRKA